MITLRRETCQPIQIQWNEGTPHRFRFLLIYLAKANHRPWTSPWFDGPQKWRNVVDL